MASTTQILAIVGAIIFGAWFFNKAGCNTDIEALCWNGPSLEEMLSGAGGGGGGGSVVDEAAALPPTSTTGGLRQEYAPGSRPGSLTPARRTGTPASRARSTGGGVGGPSSAAWAHAYFVNNRITLA